jgi:methylated-DNA-[protein]-cysteine S-methyltransferase
MPWVTYPSPIGPLTLIGGSSGLRRICFPGQSPSLAHEDNDPAAMAGAVEQLDEYFAGERTAFDLRLDLAGDELRQRVWAALLHVPYGQTTTYGALARQLGIADSDRSGPNGGYVSAAQKVGWAVGATPTPIVVPCHRVIGADGSLTGYGGGLHRKRALLDFEASGGSPGALSRRDPHQLSLL